MNNKDDLYRKIRQKFDDAAPKNEPKTRRSAPGTFFRDNKLIVGTRVGVALAFFIFIGFTGDELPNYEDRGKAAMPLDEDPTYESDAVKVRFNESEEQPNINVEEPDSRGGRGHGAAAVGRGAQSAPASRSEAAPSQGQDCRSTASSSDKNSRDTAGTVST